MILTGPAIQTIESGPGQVEVVWDSFGAESCRAGGTLPAWTDLGTLPLQGPVDFNVPEGTASGTYRLDVLCERNGREVSGQSSNNLIVLSSSAVVQPSLSVSLTNISPGGQGVSEPALLRKRMRLSP